MHLSRRRLTGPQGVELEAEAAETHDGVSAEIGAAASGVHVDDGTS